jgi:hypothetical protein
VEPSGTADGRACSELRNQLRVRNVADCRGGWEANNIEESLAPDVSSGANGLCPDQPGAGNGKQQSSKAESSKAESNKAPKQKATKQQKQQRNFLSPRTSQYVQFVNRGIA